MNTLDHATYDGDDADDGEIHLTLINIIFLLQYEHIRINFYFIQRFIVCAIKF